MLGPRGAHYLDEGRVEGDDPLAPFSPTAARHLLRTDGFAHVADIMVGSFYDPVLDEGCAFEELISFHGGLGGPQTRPFILHPPRLTLARRADHRRRRRARRARRLAAGAAGRWGPGGRVCRTSAGGVLRAMTMTPAAAEPTPPEPPEAASPAERAPRVEIVFSARTVVIALGVLLGVVLVAVVQEALLSIALALVLVLGLDPPVTALERRGWGRGKAALFVFAVIALVLFVIVVWAAKPVWNEMREFVRQAPVYVDEAQHNGRSATSTRAPTRSRSSRAWRRTPPSTCRRRRSTCSERRPERSVRVLARDAGVPDALRDHRQAGAHARGARAHAPAVAERVERTIDEVSRRSRSR